MPQKRKTSLQIKILKTITVLILIPMVVVGLYSIIQVNSVSHRIGEEGQKSLDSERTAILLNKSSDASNFLNNFFSQVENDLDRIKTYEEAIFNESISVLNNRDSYRQGDSVTQPALESSSLYGNDISLEYSDYVNISIIDEDQELYLNRSAYVDYIAAQVLINNPYYTSIEFIFKNGLSRVFPYIENGRNANEDLRTSDWYQLSSTTPAQYIYSNPKINFLGPSMYIGKAVYNGSEYIGSVAIEVQINTLRTFLDSTPIYESGYIVTFNDNELGIIHPDLKMSDDYLTIQELETDSAQMTSIISSMKSGKSQIANFTKENKDWVIAYTPVKKGGLYTAIIVPYDEIITSGLSLQDNLSKKILPSIIWSIIIIAILITGTIYATWIISKRITEPIQNLTSSIERMSQGDLTQEIALDKRHKKDEIGILALSFQNLLITMRLGNKSYYKGDLAIAYKNYQAALELFQTVNNTKGIATCYNNLGNIHRSWGDLSKALEEYNLSIELGQKLEDDNALASRFNNRGLLYMTLENWENAFKDLQKALSIDKKLGNELEIAIRIRNIGILNMLGNNLDQALKGLNEAYTTDQKLNNTPGLAEDLFQLGRLKLRVQEYELAEDYLKKSLKFAETLQNYPLMQNILIKMVELYEISDKISHLHKAQSELAKIRELLSQKKDVVFVIDLSGSMESHGKMTAARNGALEVFDTVINSDDIVSIVGFHSEIITILPPTEKSGNVDEIRSTIKSIRHSPYQTKFYDAIATGISVLKSLPQDNQKWLVTLTDGQDNCSTNYNPRNLSKIIESMDKPLNLILIGVGKELKYVAGELNTIVRASPRGKYIPIYSSKNVSQQIDIAFKKVQEIMASSEIEGFTPEGV